MSCNCNNLPCTCCTPPQPACNCPPSPIPPWARDVQSPLVDTLYQNGTLLLDPDISYLRAAAPAGPYSVVLPNGNYRKQMKRIYVPTDLVATTAVWTVTGTFAGGFTKLTFNNVGFSIFLEWDSAGWQVIGGNATPS